MSTKALFQSDRNILYHNCGDGYTIIHNFKTHQIAHLKLVNYILYKIYLDTIEFKKIFVTTKIPQ